jgi:beta-1,4-mannosyl-glycoprotein beta-1,4-N-acetylglucosaminyltransferase
MVEYDEICGGGMISKKRRVYDCFCYFNEDMLLELRFETLWNFVDYFVISEASYTHAGQDRSTEFDINKFNKYASKIRYLRLDERPIGPNNFWKNENFIRNNVANGLFDAEPDDLILISDLDEIPRPEMISQYRPTFKRADLIQNYYSYYLNNYWIGDINHEGQLMPKSNIWHGTKITTHKHFVSFFRGNATSVRIFKSFGFLRGLKRVWFKFFQNQVIQDGGWHFTWIFPIENIIKKIESTAHQEFNHEAHKSRDRILQLIMSGRDINKPHARYKIQDINDRFPTYLIKNQDKFKSFIL